MERTRKLKIVSGGAGFNTAVLDAETGEYIDGVIGVDITIRVDDLTRVVLTLDNVPIDVVANETIASA